MKKGLFITGTDTGIGKTIFTAGLLQFLLKQRIDVIPAKPIQTGCKITEDEVYIPDLEYLLSFCSKCQPSTKKLMSCFYYELECSPHLAAKKTGVYSNLEVIKDNIKKLNNIHKYILIEGAGGLMVPLNGTEMILDLIKILDFPVVVVARAGLGTINHTLMTLRVLRDASIKVFGVYINNTETEDHSSEYIRMDNIKAIEKHGNVKILGYLDHSPVPLTKKKLPDLFDKSLYSTSYIMEYFK